MKSVKVKSRLPELFKEKTNPDTGKPYTLAEIGDMVGVTKQSIHATWMNPKRDWQHIPVEPARTFGAFFGLEWYEVFEVVPKE